MKRVKVILNPIAGRGHGARVVGQIRQILQSEALDFEMALTEAPWHAAELAERAAYDGFDVIAAAGGDGTTNEVINGLMRANEEGTKAVLGMIPIGSGCDLACTLNVSTDLMAACRGLTNGRPRWIDIGLVKVDDAPPRYFGNIVGIGFDGIVNLESQKIKRVRGLAQYLPAVLKTIFLYYKALRVTIAYDDQTLEMSALMVCVTNGPREGGGFLVAPDARYDDGLFDLCMAGEVSRLEMLRMIPRFLKGTHAGHAAITMARTSEVTISSPQSLVAHIDGESLCTQAHRIACSILPHRLQIMT